MAGRRITARDALLERWGGIDILVNAAGGNVPEATMDEKGAIFDLPRGAFEQVVRLNLIGTLLPCQVFGRTMALRPDGLEARGCVVNVSAMAAQTPLTKVVGYSAAKAAVDNLTRWLAVDLARRYGPGLRVNAIAPGFFLGEQNQAILVEEGGGLAERGRVIVEHTPASRLGEPEELVGTLLWLCSPAVSFVNGVVVLVDGGFSAFGGV